jgi:hypothetical protein
MIDSAELQENVEHLLESLVRNARRGFLGRKQPLSKEDQDAVKCVAKEVLRLAKAHVADRLRTTTLAGKPTG